VKRSITAFETDEESHWMAVLACGHRRHTRHIPPLTERTWVLSEAGRASRIGTTLDCVRCDLGEPPGDSGPDRRQAVAMVLEVAILNVRAGMSDAFEIAFAEAQQILSASPGYERHELRRCLEAEDRYLLLVWWDTLESHTQGFRRSPAYARWRSLLHHFYDPFPEVEHYVSL
jgi:heme-degrading monooxygenase HmoA